MTLSNSAGMPCIVTLKLCGHVMIVCPSDTEQFERACNVGPCDTEQFERACHVGGRAGGGPGLTLGQLGPPSPS